jgi:hypothetical protein
MKRSGHTREEDVPRAMMLRAIGPRAGESTFQHAQLTNLSDVELLPSARRTALTGAADLKAEQTLGATPDPIVVRLDDSVAIGFVDKFDETLVDNRAYEVVVHGIATERLPSNVSSPFHGSNRSVSEGRTTVVNPRASTIHARGVRSDQYGLLLCDRTTEPAPASHRLTIPRFV